MFSLRYLPAEIHTSAKCWKLPSLHKWTLHATHITTRKHRPSITSPMYNMNKKLFHGPKVSCSTTTCIKLSYTFRQYVVLAVLCTSFLIQCSNQYLSTAKHLPSSLESSCHVLGKAFPSACERNVQMDLHIQSHRAALEQMQPFHFSLQIQLNLGNK